MLHHSQIVPKTPLRSVAIVIPIYKSIPSHEEIISYSRCLNILSKRQIYLLCPEGLDMHVYLQIAQGTIRVAPVTTVTVKPYFFSSIKSYNELLLSIDFYLLFYRYSYILIHQLDAYIFEDRLDEWCEKNFDYIGAPWIEWFWSEHYAKYLTISRRILSKVGYKNFNMVGNGGFSLRKISTIIFNLKLFRAKAKNFHLNEDYFFSFWLTSYNPFFKIPKFKEALGFAFDENPEQAFLLNHEQLPMGCHAWPKYKVFWEQYITS